MRHLLRTGVWMGGVLAGLCLMAAAATGQATGQQGQPNKGHEPPTSTQSIYNAEAASAQVRLTVVDENGAAVEGAQVLVEEPEHAAVSAMTNYAGEAAYTLAGTQSYILRIIKPGFYEATVTETDAEARTVRAVLNHEQIVQEQVNVTASVPGIDTEQTANQRTLNLPEIINIPYTTSRDIRNLLPFFPGVVQDTTEQVHVVGSETWATLDMLDGFDIRSPVSGVLSMRVSADAVRSIDEESTRYPVEFGRSTGGVIAFFTGMGDNKFRFNATNFIPSYREANGIRFDKFVPRFTFSGPLKKNRAWFYDGLETEYDSNYIIGLPAGADTDPLIRGSNLLKFQANATAANSLTGGVLVNGNHEPYAGLSTLMPQASTTKQDISAWMPYLRDQQSFKNGALLDVGVAAVRFRDGYEPHGTSAYEITPEMAEGSYFERETGHSQRVEGTATLYLPARHWVGEHDLKLGVDADMVAFDDALARAPVNYLREDGTLARQSTFETVTPFTRHNAEIGGYAEDRWTPMKGLLLEPGVRFDWDKIVRRPEAAPRLAAVYSPAALGGKTKISAGAGLYYEHTQLEYLERALDGIRYDTYYEADGVTPMGPAQLTQFTANYGALHEARAVNWSAGIEQRLPGAIFVEANYIHKTVANELTYVNQSTPGLVTGNFLLTNGREDHDDLAEIDARRTFHGDYTVFAAYTHSTARTNAAIDYQPGISLMGAQQSGPLGWNTPNRVISWGWLPTPLPQLRKSWDIVYALDWRTGFPYTSIDEEHNVVGAAGSRRYPNYVDLSPGLEWRFHFRGAYFGLRGVIENISGAADPLVVNNDVDSPEYGTFSEPVGRAFTARIRLIGSK
jgi:hypothetical protein